MKRSVFAILFLLFFVHIPSQNKTLNNYGVKDRTVTPTVISNVVSINPVSKEEKTGPKWGSSIDV